MSIIAKLSVRVVTPFNTGAFAELKCVCENDLMAAYAKSDEDKLFTRYSPWGEIRLNQRAGWAVFTNEESEQHVPDPARKVPTFYVVLIPIADVADESFASASAFIKVNCYSKAQFAGDGSRVELREVYGWHGAPGDDLKSRSSRANVIERMSWKMHVDNPPAEAQFKPGQDYWVAFYDASRFDMQKALALAHHGRLPEQAADQ